MYVNIHNRDEAERAVKSINHLVDEKTMLSSMNEEIKILDDNYGVNGWGVKPQYLGGHIFLITEVNPAELKQVLLVIGDYEIWESVDEYDDFFRFLIIVGDDFAVSFYVPNEIVRKNKDTTVVEEFVKMLN